MKRLPIKCAKEVSDRYNLRQVILLAWDGTMTHVVTYGKSLDDCAQAAQGGNLVKKAMGWPPDKCKCKPSRVKKLEYQITELKHKIKTLTNQMTSISECSC